MSGAYAAKEGPLPEARRSAPVNVVVEQLDTDAVKLFALVEHLEGRLGAALTEVPLRPEEAPDGPPGTSMLVQQLWGIHIRLGAVMRMVDGVTCRLELEG